MSCLTRHQKADLLALADEMDIDIESGDKIGKIMSKIKESEDFDEEWVQARLEVIVEARKAEAEKEERKAEREFELEKIRVSQAVDTVSVSSVVTDEIRAAKTAKLIMQKYDPDKSDIALFLTLFERQIKKTNIDEEYWVMHLLSLLPIEIAEIVMREPEEEADNFIHVKQLLLDRFKISPEAFRTKFVQHQRRPGSLWRDMIFDLNSYLNGWLEGVNVHDFESLKKLMVADQIKRRVPADIKDHFLTEWGNISDPNELVKKLDEYEAARKSVRKPMSSIPAEKKFQEKSKQLGKPGVDKKTEGIKNEPLNWRNPVNKDPEWRRSQFERRKAPACYHCGSTDHLRPQCPELQNSAERVNHIVVNEKLNTSFSPYLSRAKINGIEMTMLRDSGASIDLTPAKLIKPNDLTGEFIWVRQPLDSHCKRLPLARIVLESKDFGKIATKAAIVDKAVQIDYYLLGNQTHELIEERKSNPPKLESVKARSQSSRVENPNPPEDNKRGKIVTPVDNGERERQGEPGETPLTLFPARENYTERELVKNETTTFRGELLTEKNLEPVRHAADLERTQKEKITVRRELLLSRAVDHQLKAGRENGNSALILYRKDETPTEKVDHEGILLITGVQQHNILSFDKNVAGVESDERKRVDIIVFHIMDGKVLAISVAICVSNRLEKHILLVFQSLSKITESSGCNYVRFDMGPFICIVWKGTWFHENRCRTQLGVIRGNVANETMIMISECQNEPICWIMLGSVSESLWKGPNNEKLNSRIPKHYAIDAEIWVNCFRKEIDLGANIYRKKMHRAYRYWYGECKKERLDNFVFSITKRRCDKRVDRLSKLMENGKNGLALNSVSVCHKLRLWDFPERITALSEQTCPIPTDNGNDENHYVRTGEPISPERSKLKCSEPEIGVHGYTCLGANVIYYNLCPYTYAVGGVKIFYQANLGKPPDVCKRPEMDGILTLSGIHIYWDQNYSSVLETRRVINLLSSTRKKG